MAGVNPTFTEDPAVKDPKLENPGTLAKQYATWLPTFGPPAA
jgi:hypothetical protein